MLNQALLKKLVIILLPIPLVVFSAIYFARVSVESELGSLLDRNISIADEILYQVETENRKALHHPENCQQLQQSLMFERDIDEMLIVKGNDIICSSKLGKVTKPLAAYITFPHGQKLAFGTVDNLPDQFLLVVTEGAQGYQAVTMIDRDYFGVTIGFHNDLRFKRSALFIHDQIAPPDATRNGINPVATKTSKMFDYEALSEASDLFLNQRTLSYLIYTGPVILMIYLLLYGFSKWSDPRRNLVAELKKALRRQELTLYYQPQIDAETGYVFGYEALIRWEHHQKGFIAPDQFVPAAEESGLLSTLTDFVLEKAAADFSKLRFTHYVHLSVNVPPGYLVGPHVIRKIQLLHRQLSNNNVTLGIEITERQLIDEQARKCIAALRVCGIDVLIDDFGTGQTSLAFLQHMRIDYLKIDKCFVETIGIQSVSSSVLNAIVHFADELKVKLIAEGVETSEQAAHLKRLGVQYHQGYLYSKPLPYSRLARRPIT
ncbi:cyclic diguanylate phosphodiesterase [Vibrio natriegens]|uniref:EAL domain-containing protein n=1 Tax=Vibrio natriegens TaxID=691 RepID=UPI0021E84876|nr:EAL domain-containing protein [Vibrio natriegens]UYI49351.1 cyclic diguanylate phosphodiesterase [Vibrio natriegens]